MTGDPSLQYVAALVFVLSLVAALAWVLRRWGGAAILGARGAGRRLGVVETLIIDPRRRLVLLRRDEREHLILLGPNQDLVIESGIGAIPRPGGDAS